MKPFIRYMPFGKHRDTPMEELPRSYVRWALNNLTNPSEELRASLEAILRGTYDPTKAYDYSPYDTEDPYNNPERKKKSNRRINLEEDEPIRPKTESKPETKEDSTSEKIEIPKLPRGESKEAAEIVIKAGLRAISAKYHPDIVGPESLEFMSSINSTVTTLRKNLHLLLINRRH